MNQAPQVGMKGFEYKYLCVERFFPALYQTVRRRLLDIAETSPGPVRILDVGGRKSHYTIGVPAEVILSDIPRQTDLQGELHLGITNQIISELKARRSNIAAVLFDDMTHSSFGCNLFDCVVAVEVLEHVEEDDRFVREVHRVLKPGGVFLMTTPNGQFVENTNPDHKRHYTKKGLSDLLTGVFDSATVEFAVKAGFFYDAGLQSWSFKRPLNTAMSMMGCFVNSIQSSNGRVAGQAIGTQELIATARKRKA